MTHLDIPDEALAKADIWGGQIPASDLREALELAAPLLVAAELERLATELIPVHEDDADDEQQAYDDGMTQAAVELRARARELRGEAKP